MKYDVFLGTTTIYGVTDVVENSSRSVDIHNGLGQGNFTIAGDKDLRGFEVACEFTETNDRKIVGWVPAKDMFKRFERILNDKDPERLVITSDYGKISVPALLESYTKTEKFSGVYEVKIKFTEYKEASVKTTDVPYIQRAGKVPTPPAVVVFNKPSDVAKDAIKRNAGVSMSEFTYLNYWSIDKDGKVTNTRNPNLVPMNTQVTVERVSAPSTKALAESLSKKDLSFTSTESKQSLWATLSQKALESASSKWQEEEKKRLGGIKK